MKYLINNVTTNWSNFIHDELLKPYMLKIDQFLFDHQEQIVYPPKELIFNCFNFFNIEDTKVVIFGQDPYIHANEAIGLAFGISHLQTKVPPSLKNIAKELQNDLGIILNDYTLESWAKQGVLLLNTKLTVFANQSNSHQKIGWNYFIDDVLKLLNKQTQKIVFVLMGNDAKHYETKIAKHHDIITCAHPSPLSCYKGFFNSKIFSQINAKLIDKIKW